MQTNGELSRAAERSYMSLAATNTDGLPLSRERTVVFTTPWPPLAAVVLIVILYYFYLMQFSVRERAGLSGMNGARQQAND